MSGTSQLLINAGFHKMIFFEQGLSQEAMSWHDSKTIIKLDDRHTCTES